MPSSEDIRKIVTEALPDSDPLYAAAGAGDAARERLAGIALTAPAEVLALRGRLRQVAADPQAVRGQVVGAVQEVRTKVTAAVGELSGGGVRSLPDRAQSFALQQVGRAIEVAGRAREAYEGYVVRGRTVLGRPSGAAAGGGGPDAAVVRVAEPPEDEAEPDRGRAGASASGAGTVPGGSRPRPATPKAGPRSTRRTGAGSAPGAAGAGGTGGAKGAEGPAKATGRAEAKDATGTTGTTEATGTTGTTDATGTAGGTAGPKDSDGGGTGA